MAVTHELQLWVSLVPVEQTACEQLPLLLLPPEPPPLLLQVCPQMLATSPTHWASQAVLQQ